MTILVEKEACEIEKVQELGINIQDDGENYLLFEGSLAAWDVDCLRVVWLHGM